MPKRDVPTGFIGAAALLLTLGGVLLWLQMLAGPLRLGTGLLEARTHLTKAQRALEAGTFKKAVYETYAAQAAGERARRGLAAGGPLLDLARLSQTVDDALTETPHLVAAIAHSADAAEGTLEIGLGALRGPEPVIDSDPDDPKEKIIRLERIDELGATLDRVRSDVQAAGEELRAVDLSNLPRRVRPDIAEAISDAEDTDRLLARAQAGFELLPSILGAEGPRTYMLGFQNSAELRGSGGALLQFEFLTIDDGRPRLAGNDKSSNAVGSIYKLDEDRQTFDIELPPDAWYVASIEDAQRFGNFNWSPDWPMDAQLGIDYGRVSAEACGQCPEFPDVDGVIAVDPLAVKKLTPGAGPFTQGRFRISQGEVVDVILSKAYMAYPVPSTRRAILGKIVSKFFERLFNPAKPTELLQGFGASLSQKHVQIWMRDPAEQAFVEKMKWDGAIDEARKSDFLYVVEQNVGGNKLNYTATQTNEVDITLDESDAQVSTKVTVANNIRLPQPRWVLGDSKSAHRPMLNIYVPPNAVLESAETGELCAEFSTDRSCNGRINTPSPAVWNGEVPPEHLEKNKKVWSATLQIPSLEEGSFGVDYRVPGVVIKKGNRSHYRLIVQRQPKVTPEDLVVALRVPGDAVGIKAPGFKRDGKVLVYERPLTKDTVLEVSWRS